MMMSEAKARALGLCESGRASGAFASVGVDPAANGIGAGICYPALPERAGWQLPECRPLSKLTKRLPPVR